MNRSKSMPIITNFQKSIKSNISFNDFNKLNLLGKQQHLSFGEFVSLHSNTTKIKRQKVIKYFYQNLYN